MGQVERRHPVGVVPACSSGRGLSFPAGRAGAGTFPGKTSPRQLLEKPGALPGSGRQVCGCVGGSMCSPVFILALCGASGQRAWPGLRSGIAKEWEL